MGFNWFNLEFGNLLVGVAEDRVDELLAAPLNPGELEDLGELPAHGSLQ